MKHQRPRKPLRLLGQTCPDVKGENSQNSAGESLMSQGQLAGTSGDQSRPFTPEPQPRLQELEVLSPPSTPSCWKSDEGPILCQSRSLATTTRQKQVFQLTSSHPEISVEAGPGRRQSSLLGKGGFLAPSLSTLWKGLFEIHLHPLSPGQNPGAWKSQGKGCRTQNS